MGGAMLGDSMLHPVLSVSYTHTQCVYMYYRLVSAPVPHSLTTGTDDAAPPHGLLLLPAAIATHAPLPWPTPQVPVDPGASLTLPQLDRLLQPVPVPQGSRRPRFMGLAAVVEQARALAFLKRELEGLGLGQLGFSAMHNLHAHVVHVPQADIDALKVRWRRAAGMLVKGDYLRIALAWATGLLTVCTSLSSFVMMSVSRALELSWQQDLNLRSGWWL